MSKALSLSLLLTLAAVWAPRVAPAPGSGPAFVPAREQGISHRSDLEFLYRGVRESATDFDYVNRSGRCPTTAALAHKPNAFTVFNNKDVGPGPVAAGRFGKGKIFFTATFLDCLFPVSGPRGAHPGQERLAHNTLAWLSQGSRTPYAESGPALRILQQAGIGREGLSDTLYNIDVVPVSDLLAETDKFDPAAFPVAVVSPAIADPAVEELLAGYVERGGSLLMGRPVPRDDLRDYPGQRLLDRAGILWSRQWAWIRGPVPSIGQLLEANVWTILEMAKAAERDGGGRSDRGFRSDSLEYYIKVMDAVSPDIMPRRSSADFKERLHDEYAALNLSYPVRGVDRKPYTRLLVSYYHRLLEMEPGQPPAPGADFYPGSVDARAPRVTRSFVFDFNQQSFKDRLRVIYEIEHRVSTGMYAAPGDDITITVSEGTPYSSRDGSPKVWVRIGTYGWDISGRDVWNRPPAIAFSQELTLGRNVVSNPFGGLIYIWTPTGNYRDAKVNVEISGGVEAPYFVLGRDTNEDWVTSLRSKPAPWAEVQSRHMIQALPSEQIRGLDDVEEIARTWDRIMQNVYDLTGLSETEGYPHTAPDLPSRIVSEVQLMTGAAHAGYPIGVGMHHPMNTLDGILYGSIYHEIGHNFHPADFYCFDGSHPQADLVTLYQEDYFKQPSRVKQNDRYAQAATSLAAGKAWTELSDPEQLVFYGQLRLAFGWAPFTRLYRYVRELAVAERPADDTAKCDLFLTKMSEYSGLDLRSHFAHYGIPNSAAALRAVEAMRLPEPDPPIWTLNEGSDGTLPEMARGGRRSPG